MRRALLIGIDNYESAPLNGCVADVVRIHPLLKNHYNDDPNFDCRTMVAPRDGESLGKARVMEAIRTHFSRDADAALLHFSGHGVVNELGGYLVTSDGRRYDEGISMHDLMRVVNASKIPEVTILLDCCHSGALGQTEISGDAVMLREGVALLTASGRSEVSMEKDGGGLFTSLVCDALEGQAADVFGNVTVAGIYSHVDPQLSAWDQRPRLRANLKRLTPIRRTEPPIDRAILRRLPEFFSTPGAELRLDPSFESTAEPRNPENEAVFAQLQLLCRQGLAEPVGEKHMYDAAMRGGACRLTHRGQRCWHLAKNERI